TAQCGAGVGAATATRRMVARDAALLVYGLGYAGAAGDGHRGVRWPLRFRVVRAHADWLGGDSRRNEYGKRLLRRPEGRGHQRLAGAERRDPARAADGATGADWRHRAL